MFIDGEPVSVLYLAIEWIESKAYILRDELHPNLTEAVFIVKRSPIGGSCI